MEFGKKGSISICWRPSLRMSFCNANTQRGHAQDVGVCVGWDRCSLGWRGNRGVWVMRTGAWEPLPVCEDYLKVKLSRVSWQEEGFEHYTRSRTVFEYKRCLPHKVWGWLSPGASIMKCSSAFRVGGLCCYQPGVSLYKYLQLFSKSALSGGSE